MSFKQNVYSTCVNLLNEKISSLRNSLSELETGAENDNKSSAGDKHETARAMMQIEQEKLGKQLNDSILQFTELEKIGPSTSSAVVTKGSLLETNQGFLFLSVALGKINVGGRSVVVLSPQSPLGIKLIGLGVNDVAEINGTKYVIEVLT